MADALTPRRAPLLFLAPLRPVRIKVRQIRQIPGGTSVAISWGHDAARRHLSPGEAESTKFLAVTPVSPGAREWRRPDTWPEDTRGRPGVNDLSLIEFCCGDDRSHCRSGAGRQRPLG